MRKAVGILLMSVLLVLFAGCEKKVITAADDITLTEGETPDIPVIESFEKKVVIADDLPEIGSVVLKIPEGYVPSKEDENFYVSELYPLDSSNICYSRSDGRDVGMVDKNLTKEQYEEAIEEAFAAEDKTVDLVIDEFTAEDLQGIPSYKIRSHYNTGYRRLQMLTYIIASSETYVITYSQLSDDELFTDFNTDEGQICLIREKY